MSMTDAELTVLVKPEYLTLVKSPANRTGFKVIRDDSGGAPRILRTRAKVAQNSDGELLSIELTQGISGEEALELMTTFGLGDDYELSQSADGNYSANRKKAKCGDETVTDVHLDNGIVAHISHPEVTTRSSLPVVGATLVGLAFPAEFGDEAKVRAWLDANGVEACPVTQEAGVFVAKRHDVPEGADVRTITLADGVQGSVAKTKNSDIPPSLQGSVVEQAYGSWGWGHLSFSSALFDPEFTDHTNGAVETLRGVLENVLVYSGLALTDRKALAANACDQFLAYINMLIDALPQGVMKAARADRSTSMKPETIPMATPTPDNTAGTTNAGFVTRADLETFAESVISKAMSGFQQLQDDAKKRADEETAAKAAAEEQKAQADKTTELLTAITQRMDKIDAAVQEIGGKTTVRSPADGVDTEQPDSKKRSDDPFDGMLTSLLSGIAK